MVALTASLAAEFGYRLAVSDRLWTSPSRHGSYPGLAAVLSLAGIPLDSELAFPAGVNVSRREVGSREEFMGMYHLGGGRLDCFAVVTVDLGGPTSCRSGRGPDSCFYTWPGAFRRARRLVQAAVRRAPPPPGEPARFHPAWRRGELAVAWHLRCGDVVLVRLPEFFAGVRAAVAAAGVPLRDYLFREPCAEFDFLRGLMPDAEVVTAGVAETVRHLAAADVLVHTGSSLASAAALVAAGPQLYVQSPPKEGPGMPAATYAVSSAVVVNELGRLVFDQPFLPWIPARPAAGPPGPAGVGGGDGEGAPAGPAGRRLLGGPRPRNSTLVFLPQVSRFIRALHARRFPPPPQPAAAAEAAAEAEAAETAEAAPEAETAAAGPDNAAVEARELDDLLGYRVLSGALAKGTAEEAREWEWVAAVAHRLLPGWAVRLHYDSGRNASLCALRALHNVELVDMSGSGLAEEWWPYAVALEGDGARAALFVGPAAAVTVCQVDRASAWQACGAPVLPPLGGGGAGGCCDAGPARACGEAGGCVWGVRSEALGAVRSAVRCAAADPDCAAAERLRLGFPSESELLALEGCD